MSDIGDPKITIRQTYEWEFPDLVVPSGWSKTRYVIRGMSIRIERGQRFYDDDYMVVSCYGVEAKKDGTPDKRSQWGWSAYPEHDFVAPYEARAKELWASVHGEFREEPET